MDNDTPSSSAAAVAMDVVDALRGQHNNSNNHYQSNPSYHHHHHQAHSHSMDEDELRRYIVASPMSQSSAGDTGGSAAGINLHALFGSSSNSSSSAGQQHNAQYGQMQPASAPPPPLPSSASPASSSAASLETALAALGEQGRQQLLAILQLANSGAGASGGQQQQQQQHQTNSNNVHQQPAPHPSAASSSSSSIPSHHHQPPSASNDGFNFPLNLFGQATAHGSGQQGQGQGPGSSSNHSSGNSPASNSSNGNNINNNNNAVNAAIAAALSSSSASASAAAAAAAAPGAFYSNAFRQYSAFPMMSQSQQQQQHISASTPASASNSNSSARPSPALSAISHSHSHSQSQSQAQQSLPPNAIHFTAPTGTASTGNYANTGHSSSYQQQSHLQQQHHQGLPSSSTTASSSGADNSSHINNNSLGGGFSLPDANLFRSPAVFGSIPGTSSSAFYSDNGNGDDTDLLFTPLMSPALTASTQPGPSVGPLPESFANLTTQHFQQKFTDNLGMSQGVAPMTVFSPLTSPALRPQQGGGAGGSNNNGNGNGIKSSSGGSSGSLPATASSTPATSPQRSTHTTGKIRGASKNNAKTRPSPIIRPTVDTFVTGNGNGGMQSAGAHGSSAKALSRTSSVSSTSKRHTQSAAPTPLMMSTSTFGGQSQSQSQGHGQGQGYHGSQPYQHVSSRQSSSVPASPAFYATHMNMNMSNNSSSASVGGGTPNSGHSAAVGNGASSSSSKAASGNNNVNTNSQLGKLHETVAQTAVQNSPSPHQFDLSGLMPAYAAMVAQGQSAYPYSAQLPYGQQMQQPSHQQQYSHGQASQQQQQPQSYQAQLPSNALSGSTSGSLEDLMSLPSPLDLNNILSMLGQNNSFPQTSGADGSMSNAYGASDPSSGFTTSLGNSVQQSTMQDSLRGMDQFMKDQSTMYQQQQQQQQQQAPRGPYHPHHQHSTSDSSVSAATAAFLGPPTHGHNVGAEQGQHLVGGAKPGPLTPASFMNLPANQYTVLAGLLADHQPPNRASSATVQHQDDSAVSSTSQKSGKSDLAGSAKSKKQIDKIGTSKAHSSKTGQESKKKASQSKLATLNEDQTDAVMESSDIQPPAPSPEEMRLAINSNSTAPVSPALLAQNIKQVAAAAIAAKDAKSRARGRGNARRKSTIGGQQQQTLLEEDADVKPLNLDKSASSKKQTVNGTPVLSPEKPFMHDESAAPSVYGESRPASTETSPMLAAQSDTRKSSHKIAEQRRRDSLKLCFEELRFILPPINPDEDEDFNGGPGSRRPGENNVGGQRGKNYTVDPKHPNRGISKVALLRKSNEYVTKLHDRVDRRDAAIRMLREELRLCRVALGQGKPGDDKALDGLSNVDFDDLEQDNDQIPPTYRLHGLHAPGSKLSLSAMFFEPSERTIEEDDREDMEEDQDEDGDDNDDEEYKAKRPRKKANTSSKANTRNTAKANVSA